MSTAAVAVTLGGRRVQLPRADAERALAMLSAIDDRCGDVHLVLPSGTYSMHVQEAISARRELQAALTGRTS